MGKSVYIYICIYVYIFIYIHMHISMHIICTKSVCIYAFTFTRGKFGSTILNLSTGCFAVYAKRVRLISLKKIASYL